MGGPTGIGLWIRPSNAWVELRAGFEVVRTWRWRPCGWGHFQTRDVFLKIYKFRENP